MLTGNQSVGALWIALAWIAPANPLLCQVASNPAPRQADEACYPIEEILSTLAYSGGPKSGNPEATLIAAIQRRTICSRPTAEELDTIKRAGASARLMNAVDANAPAPAAASAPPGARPCLQPAPPAPKRGRLTVTCPEVECSVIINGAPMRTTAHGAISEELPEGTVAVEAAAKGYEPERDQEMVDIRESEPKVIRFEFHPSRAALEEYGASLFGRMIAALGGDAGLKTATRLRGTGSFIVYRDGKPESWEATISMKLPDKARLSVSAFQGGRPRYEIVTTGGRTELLKAGKGAELEDLNLALHQFQRYQLAATLQRLEDPGFKIVATDLRSSRGAGTTVRAERGSEAYAIRLDAELRPEEIRLESGGFDQGIQVLYSDYIQQGEAYFPKKMRVERPGAVSNAIQMQFDRVQLNPADLTDGDFAAKRGRP